jgi:hypothetical protein
MNKTENTQKVQIRLPHELLEELKESAKNNCRTLSQEVIFRLTRISK